MLASYCICFNTIVVATDIFPFPGDFYESVILNLYAGKLTKVIISHAETLLFCGLVDWRCKSIGMLM